MDKNFILEYELLNCETGETLLVIEKEPRTCNEVKARAWQLIEQYNFEDFTGIEPFLFMRYSIYDITGIQIPDPVEVEIIKELATSDDINHPVEML